MKKYITGILTIVLAVGFSAFNVPHAKTAPRTGEKWFLFNGTDPADLNDATKYSMDGTGGSPTVCPTDITSAYRCEILAVPTGSPAVPVLTTIIDERKRTNP